MLTLNTFRKKINFRVYAKFQGQKKFRPLNIEQGIQVNNLIRATIVNIEKFEQLKNLVELNKSVCSMQIRNLNNKVVY